MRLFGIPLARPEDPPSICTGQALVPERTGRSAAVILRVLALASVLTACGEDINSPAILAPDDPRFSVSPALGAEAFDLDAEWASVAENVVKGFAGYHKASSGEYIVSVSHPAASEQARILVTSWLAAAGRTSASVRTRDVAYGFDQLVLWKTLLVPLLGDRVYWVDADEVRNTVTLGIESMADRESILEAAVALGVPSEAITVIETGEPVERATLQDYVRPVVGGLQIQFSKSGRTANCTLGFNATQGTVNGFVTASHCSSSKFQKDNTVQYQNSLNISSERIGTEFKDPSSGRDSDASYFSFDSGVNRDWGRIARTTAAAVNQAGPLTIDGSYPRFRITSKGSNTIQVFGELVNKVGRTSGWTQGQIVRTCVTLSSLPCQWEALVWSEGGDSGSPIFQQAGSSEPDASRVSLWGVLWGGPVGDWTTTWYSPISGVEQDLGTLNVTCDPNVSTCYPPPYATINGYMTIKTAGTYTWTASAYHGDGTYTYQWYYRPDGAGTWSSVGTGTSVSRYVDSSDYPGFELRLTVTSVGMSYTAELPVAVLIL